MWGKDTSSVGWRISRVVLAIALIVSFNASVVFVWNHYFPGIPLLPEREDASSREDVLIDADVTPVSVIPAPPGDAHAVVEQLLDVAPSPGDGWTRLPGEPNTVGTVFDVACPTDSVTTASLHGQVVWVQDVAPTPSAAATDDSAALLDDTSSVNSPLRITHTGVSEQVRIYPAGVGAVAVANMREQLFGCANTEDGWALTSTLPASVGVEGFTATFSAERDSMSITVFRFGDVVGVVSSRNGPSSTELSIEWSASWPLVLRDACLNLQSTMQDARRQPILQGRYSPLTESRKIKLAETRIAEIRVEQEPLGRSEAVKRIEEVEAKDVDLSVGIISAPREAKGSDVSLVSVPSSFYGLSVALPDPPQELMPAPPPFPRKPSSSVSVFGPVADEDGPGCGWRLLGQPMPPFDAEAAAGEWGERIEVAEASLSDNYASWMKRAWRYATDYAIYVAEAERWNAWAREAQAVVALADWKRYDDLLETYEEAAAKYLVDLEDVLACEREREDAARNTPAPTPSVTPSENDTSPAPTLEPNPEPSPSPLPSCDPRPTQPTAPTQPPFPRPVAVP